MLFSVYRILFQMHSRTETLLNLIYLITPYCRLQIIIFLLISGCLWSPMFIISICRLWALIIIFIYFTLFKLSYICFTQLFLSVIKQECTGNVLRHFCWFCNCCWSVIIALASYDDYKLTRGACGWILHPRQILAHIYGLLAYSTQCEWVCRKPHRQQTIEYLYTQMQQYILQENICSISWICTHAETCQIIHVDTL